jgi:hypothetical protein
MLDVAMLSPRFPFKGIIPPKKSKCSLAKIVARVNWGTAPNRTFEAVFYTVSSLFAIDRLAAIGTKITSSSAVAAHRLTGIKPTPVAAFGYFSV